MARDEGLGAVLERHRLFGGDASGVKGALARLDGIGALRDQLAAALRLLARLAETDRRKGAEAGVAFLPARVKRKIQPFEPPGATRR